ncbi:site-2 protease family protein [Streptomyces mutabilis]|uniref:site-2 protease family protein n=1 Tax=Streptomyces mutabilis TaxID=67332 RepID=UPI003687B3BA
MDVSGGSGRPRPGNDESAEPRAEPTAPASGSARPEPADTGPPGERPADRPGQADEHHGQPAPTAPEPTGARPPTDDSGTRAPKQDTPGTPDTEAPGSEPQASRTPAPGAGASATPGPGKPEPETPETKTPGTVTPETGARGPRVPGATRPDPHTDGGSGPGKPPQRKPEPGGGLLMGRPFGVPVYVAPSWFLVAALITWVFGGQLDRVLPELGAARYLVSLFFAVAFYASVLVHELAHTVAALRFKLPVRRIQLQFFGGVSEIEKEAETPGREFVLAFVGPLLSLVLAGVFYAALLPVEPDSVPGVLLAGLMISNLLVAAFNLLPGLPLDGGRMLRAVVWKITGKPMSGTIAAAWIGRALAIAVLIGLPLLTQSLGSDAADDVGMDTVMDALLAAILAAIIWTGAGNSLRMARLREHLPELRARALTRRAVPVPADTPLSEALRRANASGARALVVVDADGAPVSLVREAAIVGVPEHRRPWVPVSTLAQDLTDGMRVSAELSGEELLDALRANPATEYLVVEETGEIYGVLSAADVERAFVKAMARPS